jgi:hypothetical protein
MKTQELHGRILFEVIWSRNEPKRLGTSFWTSFFAATVSFAVNVSLVSAGGELDVLYSRLNRSSTIISSAYYLQENEPLVDWF